MSETRTDDPKEKERREWVKAVLNVEVPTRPRGEVVMGGQRGEKGPGSETAPPDPDKAKREEFEKKIGPRATELKQSLARTGKLKTVDAKVRTAEKTATEAHHAAQDAAGNGKWDQTDGLIKTFDDSMKALEQAYTAAANELDARIGRRLTKLERLVESLEGTKLDASAAKKARDEVSLAEAKANQSPAGDVRLVALFGALEVADKAAIASAGLLKGKGNQAQIAGLEAFRKSAADAIKDITVAKTKKEFDGKLVEWDKLEDKALKETDLDKQKDQLSECEKQIRKMMADAAKAGGGDADAKQQEAFKEALKKKFGLEIDVPVGMTNTHFDKMYDMMSMLPVQHVSQDKLKKLAYDKDSKGAAFGGATIFMGDYGDAKGDWGYKDPKTGKSEPLNGFNISTLHEVGHSVDAKYGIMSNSNMAKEGFGGWKNLIPVDDIVKLFADDFLASAGKDTGLTEGDVKPLVKNALTKAAVKNPGEKDASVKPIGDGDKPGGMTPENWAKLKPVLDKCVNLRSDKWPWGKGKAVAFNGQAYHESYPNKWVSYSVAARAKGEVRDYQWRAPGEWFAELYAYSWFKKEKPANHIDSVAAKYMYTTKT
jgi:hypothetical protein